MRSTYLKNIFIIIGLIVIVSALVAFMSNSSIIPDASDTTLLDRSEKIQLGKEWENVQNQYAANREKFLTDNDMIAGLNLAYIYIREARVTGEHGHYYPAALKVLDHVLSSQDTKGDLRFRALTCKAGVELSLHEFSKALTTGEKALKLNPQNAQVYGVLVDANVELGNYAQAIVYGDKMVGIKPDLRSYSRISYLREIHGDTAGAFDAMQLAVKSGYPGMEDTAWAMLTLGEMYEKYGHPDSAEELYREILKMREDYPFAIAALGNMYYREGKVKVAEKTIQDAMDIIPEVGFYIQMAMLYKEQNREKEFEFIVSEIFEMLEDDVVHGHNMNLEYADLYLELLDDTSKAKKYATIEYNKRPNNIDTNAMLAKILAKENDKDMAKNYLNKAMITNAKYPELLELSKQL